MTSNEVDDVTRARTALAAASTTEAPDAKAYYLGAARCALARLRADVGQLTGQLDAAEGEAVRVASKAAT